MGPESQSSRTSHRQVVYLHVGGPKTGTTYLQEVLWRNRDALRRNDLLYPGRDRGAHFHAVQDLLGFSFHQHKDPRVPGAWDRLVNEVRSGPRTSVISHELFALASSKKIHRAMQALSFAEVHVIYTARDLARQIPSVWQEDLRNRNGAQRSRLNEYTWSRCLGGDRLPSCCGNASPPRSTSMPTAMRPRPTTPTRRWAWSASFAGSERSHRVRDRCRLHCRTIR